MHSTAFRSAVRRSMLVVGLAGGFIVLGAGIAASTATADELAPPSDVVAAEQATVDDDNDETSGENGTGSGNQVEADVEAPVDASDNQVTVIGDGNQNEGGSSEPENGVEPDADADHTSGEDGTLSGNQVEAEAEAPVRLTGNQVTVVGEENTSGGSTSEACQDDGTGSGDTTNGDDGLLSGNQVDVDADAPVDASGNQVTVIGDENTSGGSSTNGCDGSGGSTGGDGADGADGTTGGDTTSGEDGAASGNQLTLDPDAPVDASGNQLTVLGDGNQSGGSTGESTAGDQQNGSDGDDGGDVTSGEDGAASGNQLTLAPAAPVDASGNQLTVLGDGNQSGGSTEGDQQAGSDGGDTTSGEGGTGAGNQLTVDPVARVDADDNQVTVLGDDNDSGDPADGDDGTSGSGDPADGTDDGDNESGDGDRGDRDEQVRGLGAGGPGNPGAAVLGTLPTDAGPATTALPQTGATHGPGLALLGLVMLLGGLVLTARRREVVDG